MAIITKASAKTYFITGAFPTQAQFADTIDTYLGLGEAGAQTVQGAVNFQSGVTVSGNSNFVNGVQVSGNPIRNAAYEKLATVVVDDGVGNLTIGAAQVTSAMLVNTAVSAGTYISPTLTINNKGQITNASSPNLFNINVFTRDVSFASGTQSVTGIGFTPRAVIFFAQLNSNSIFSTSAAFDNITATKGVFMGNTAAVSGSIGSGSIYLETIAGGASSYSGKVNSFDADGFTISWTKTGTPTGTLSVSFLAFK